MDEKSSEEGPASLLLRQGWGQWRCRQMGSPCSVETWRRNPAEASRGARGPWLRLTVGLAATFR